MSAENFESFDDLLKRLNQLREESAAAAVDWRQRIKPGDFCVVWDGEAVYYVEILETPADHSPALGPNLRWSRGYSQREPTGSLGAIDVSAIAGTITRAQFELALNKQWPSSTDGFATVVAGDPRWSR